MYLSFSLAIIALVCGLIVTPLVRDLFLRLNFVDLPDTERKLHSGAIPRVGGIAVFLSYAGSLLLARFIPFAHADLAVLAHGRRTALLIGVLIIFATGVVDDLIGLSPKQKLSGQLLGALAVWGGGVQIRLLHGVPLESWISLVATVAWLLACSNAMNLIDGLDGLAAGAGLLSCVAMIAAAAKDQNVFLAMMVAPLMGALVAFLRYNFNPATIFLGDSGSLTIGFLLGCFGILWSEKITTVLGMGAPLMALSVPLLDTGLSIARRFLRARPIFGGDRGHIHHRLLDRGNTPRQTALLLYAVSAVAAVFAVLQSTVSEGMAVLVALGFLLAVYTGIRHLGYLEFGFAHKLVAGRQLFCLIDDHMLLQTLESSVRNAKTAEDAYRMLEKTCVALGFREAMVLSREACSLAFGDLGLASVTLPLGTEDVLLLQGFPPHERPTPLWELQNTIRRSFDAARWRDSNIRVAVFETTFSDQQISLTTE